MAKSTVKSFVKSFLAIVTGDSNMAQAEKGFRQASSALKTQISSLGGDTITFEDAVETAQEAKANARVGNGQPITDRNTYVENLLRADNNVVSAQKALETHKKKIAFLEAELKALEEDVEVEVVKGQ